MPETRNDRRKRQCTHASSPSPHQHVHRPWLKADIYASDYNQQHSEDSRVLEETVVPVADGRSKEYCDWWRDHSTGRDNLGGLGVRLIGDASSPELFTSMAHNDLAYSRVVEHQATGTPINLVLPVFTRPDVVQQAVAGILSGQISLSLMNVEALLVLANAVGFVALEAACVKYLCGQAQHMKARALVHLAQLADHLGLSSLLDAAAESVVVLPWHHNMEWLVALLKIPVYQKNTEQRNKLLHHPQRGACTELQVLAVLEHVGIPRADFASAVDLQGLQPAELRALLVILVDCEEDGPFLRAAVKQDLVPEALRAAPDRTQNVRILHNVVIPDAQSTLTLPDSMLTLDVRVCKDKEGQDLVGIYLQASADNLLCNHVHHFTIFALHPSKPYVRLCRGSRSKPVRRSWGWSNYLTRLQKEYPTGYSGPFTIGVSWQAVDNKVA